MDARVDVAQDATEKKKSGLLRSAKKSFRKAGKSIKKRLLGGKKKQKAGDDVAESDATLSVSDVAPSLGLPSFISEPVGPYLGEDLSSARSSSVAEDEIILASAGSADLSVGQATEKRPWLVMRRRKKRTGMEVAREAQAGDRKAKVSEVGEENAGELLDSVTEVEKAGGVVERDAARKNAGPDVTTEEGEVEDSARATGGVVAAAAAVSEGRKKVLQRDDSAETEGGIVGREAITWAAKMAAAQAPIPAANGQSPPEKGTVAAEVIAQRDTTPNTPHDEDVGKTVLPVSDKLAEGKLNLEGTIIDNSKRKEEVDVSIINSQKQAGKEAALETAEVTMEDRNVVNEKINGHTTTNGDVLPAKTDVKTEESMAEIRKQKNSEMQTIDKVLPAKIQITIEETSVDSDELNSRSPIVNEDELAPVETEMQIKDGSLDIEKLTTEIPAVAEVPLVKPDLKIENKSTDIKMPNKQILNGDQVRSAKPSTKDEGMSDNFRKLDSQSPAKKDSQPEKTNLEIKDRGIDIGQLKAKAGYQPQDGAGVQPVKTNIRIEDRSVDIEKLNKQLDEGKGENMDEHIVGLAASKVEDVCNMHQIDTRSKEVTSIDSNLNKLGNKEVPGEKDTEAETLKSYPILLSADDLDECDDCNDDVEVGIRRENKIRNWFGKVVGSKTAIIGAVVIGVMSMS